MTAERLIRRDCESGECFVTGKPEHGERLATDVPSDLTSVPPVPCPFKAGDRVIYTNDYGVSFPHFVRGFSSKAHSFGFIYLNVTPGSAWWMPHAPESLKLAAA